MANSVTIKCWTLSAFLLFALLALGGCAAPRATATSPSESASTSATLPQVHHNAGPHRVSLLENGSEIEFLGEITDESMSELKAVLDANPSAKVLQLTSPGGSRKAVNSVFPQLMERGMTTVVPLFCASACVELFLAGRERVLIEGAALAFHQSRALPNETVKAASLLSQAEAASNTQMLDRMIDRGVDPAFAQKAIATPHDSLWYPTRSELLAAGVVTQSAAMNQYAEPSTGPDRVALLDWSVLNDSLSAAYRLAYPEDYANTRQAFWQAVNALGFEAAESQNQMVDHISKALAPSLAVTTDAAAAAFYKGLLSAITYLNRRDPLECHRFLKGSLVSGVGLSNEARERIASHLGQVFTALFLSLEFSEHQAPPSRDAYNSARHDLLANAVDSGVFTEEDLPFFRDPESHPERSCSIVIRMMEAMLNAEQPDRGLLLRGMMLHKKSKSGDTGTIGS